MDEMPPIRGYNSESSQTSYVVKHPAHCAVEDRVPCVVEDGAPCAVEDRAYYAIKNRYS